MTDDRKTKELFNETEKLLTKSFEDVFSSKTFICSIYLLKYLNDKNEEYFNKSVSMLKDFTLLEKMQVIYNVKANLIEQEKLKELKKTI